MSSRKLMISALGALTIASTLTACNTWNRHIGDEDPYFAEAAKYNAAVQTINPEPVYAERSAQPGDNGDKMQQAVERYRTDKVNERHTKESRVRSTSGLNTTQGPE